MRTLIVLIFAVIVIGGAAWIGIRLRAMVDNQRNAVEERRLAREEAEARALNERLRDPNSDWNEVQPRPTRTNDPRRNRRTERFFDTDDL